MILRRRAAAGLALGVALLAGCGSPDAPAHRGSGPATVTRVERCASALPAGTPVRDVRLTGSDGTDLSAADFGSSEGSATVLVLLHQTGPSGLCGWGRFAAAAAERGMASIAIDMCGYGDSECAPGVERDPAAQADLALAHARDDLGARRVVLVGASMGGSSTVIAVADGVRADAWVDVSGVSSWDGVRLQSLADELADGGLPGLVVYARSDGPLQYGAAQRLARTAGARFLDGGSGHGYALLTDTDGQLLPAGEAVLRFARGA